MTDVAPATLSRQVAEKIRDLIHENVLVSGEKLNEQKLCAQLGVSRTPLREALRALCSEGLVRLYPNRGAYVAEVSIEELRHTVSISPVLDPQKSTTEIDHYPIIKSYFLKKWRTSLEEKQQLFPDLYDFSAVFTHKTLQEVTDVLLSGYSDYGSSAEYFKAYSVLNDDLINIRVPTTIIAAADDPIIPIEDFKNLDTNDLTNLVIQPYGGHNGFLTGWSLQSWYEQQLVDLFDGIVAEE